MSMAAFNADETRFVSGISPAVSGISKSGILEKLIKMKYDIPNDKPEMFDEYISEIDSVINSLNLK